MTIKQVRILDPWTGRDGVGDLQAGDGRSTIDGRGLVAAPGLVDVHVHFRDPGLTYKEDLESGARSALCGGFTTVICMANTKPPVDRADVLRDILQRAKRLPIRVYQAAAATKGLRQEELCDFGELRAAGAACFTDDGVPIASGPMAYAAMCEAAKLDAVLSLHEEDPAFIWDAGVNAGEAARALGLRGAPAAAEDALVARDCVLALRTGARVHIQHLSSALSVEMVRTARRLGARVTAEATPHHFTLTEESVARFGTNAKMNPPLRTRQDRDAIREGLRDGTIEMIATDHAPHAAREKAAPFAQAPSGIVGLETSLALGLTHLVGEGTLTLMQLIERMTAGPARAFGLDAGRIGGGSDLVLFDPQEEWTVGGFQSKSANSPFLGARLRGRVKYVIARGTAWKIGEDGAARI